MEENLVIVESPAKAKTIEKFLGEKFLVKSSFGHIRDLSKKNLGIDIKNNFEPDYIVSEDKTKVVNELKKLVKNAKTVWLASDEDREGEAIAWHLAEVLKLNPKNTKRIVFNEITKEAITRAIKNPREIDVNLVNAQQARRILDRLVGFELSPVLWKKIKSNLSAGRVQSVSVRLIVEREREINAFKSHSYYRIIAIFNIPDKKGKVVELEAELQSRFESKDDVLSFLKNAASSEFSIKDIVTKPSKKSSSPPFTTSTLQQEASRKLGYSVAQTMSVAQKLYEAGKITYMRTDSVNLSDTALKAAEAVIKKEFGDNYVHIQQYKTKSKGAQEAHEAIRPTYMENDTVAGTPQEKKLYELIWKRTVASQMADASLEKTTATIAVSKSKEYFVATGEVLKFDGFLKLYIESTDEEQEEGSKILPPLTVNQKLDLSNIAASQRFTHHPARYTEASLVKKLEELGIGRPSTYAPTISTIQQRGYVLKEDRTGEERNYVFISLEKSAIKEQVKTENTGAEKSKLFPTDIGIVVNDYLVENFKDILDYNFTASVEKDFDEIAEGKVKWEKMLKDFYQPFHSKVELAGKAEGRSVGERLLGSDPTSGKNVYVRIGRYGPMVQIGESQDEEKPRFASLLKGQHIESLELKDALKLFELPRYVGDYENTKVAANTGRFGPYLQHNSKFYSLPKGDDMFSVNLDRAIEIIEDKREKDKNKLIQEFSQDAGLKVLNGRFGPYISYNKENFKIPKTKDPKTLSFDDCLELIKVSKESPSSKKSKTTAKKKK